MKEIPLETLNDTQLLEETKKRKSGFMLFAFIVLLQIVPGIYLTYIKGFNTFTVIPLCFMPLAFVYYKNYKNAKIEVEKRNLQ